MAFQVPASKASKGQDQFEFTIGTATFSVTKTKYVPVPTLIDIEDDLRAAVAFFAGSTAVQGKAVRGLDREQFAGLLEAWREDSELTEGESQASDG